MEKPLIGELSQEERRRAEELAKMLTDPDGVIRWGAKDPRLTHEEAILMHVYLWDIPRSVAAEIVGMARGTMPPTDILG